jgi:hypothetical protein
MPFVKLSAAISISIRPARRNKISTNISVL